MGTAHRTSPGCWRLNEVIRVKDLFSVGAGIPIPLPPQTTWSPHASLCPPSLAGSPCSCSVSRPPNTEPRSSLQGRSPQVLPGVPPSRPMWPGYSTPTQTCTSPLGPWTEASPPAHILYPCFAPTFFGLPDCDGSMFVSEKWVQGLPRIGPSPSCTIQARQMAD